MRIFQKLYHFFVWCAGSDFEILNRAPRYEHIMHALFGGFVWIPAILNTISMTYAFTSLGLGFLASIIIGLFWGIVIFIIDRYFVASRPLNKGKMNIVLRFALALIFSILVAHTLLIFFFKNEIEYEMGNSVSSEVIYSLNGDLKTNENGDSNWKMLNHERDSLKTKINFHSEQVYTLKFLSDAELKGEEKSGNYYGGKITTSKEKNKGMRYSELQTNIYNEDSIIRSIKDTVLKKVQIKIDSIEKNTRFHVEKSNKSIIKKMLVLNKLENENSFVKIIKWFLVFLLIVIDLLPLSLKYTSNRGQHYDKVIQEYENKHSIFSEYYHNDTSITKYQAEKEIEQRKRMIEADIHSENIGNHNAYVKVGLTVLIHILIASALAGIYYLSMDCLPNTTTLYAIIGIYFISSIIFEILRK